MNWDEIVDRLQNKSIPSGPGYSPEKGMWGSDIGMETPGQQKAQEINETPEEPASTPQYTETPAVPPTEPAATTSATTEPAVASSDPAQTYSSSGFNNIAQSLASPTTSIPYDTDYVNLMAGNLRQDLMNTASSSRSELANRLASYGIEGGIAQDQLGGVDRAASQGMASGMSDIYQNAMENAYQKLLGVTDRQIQVENLNQQFGLQTREDQMQFAQFLIQSAMYADAEESQRLMELAGTLMSGGNE